MSLGHISEKNFNTFGSFFQKKQAKYQARENYLFAIKDIYKIKIILGYVNPDYVYPGITQITLH